MNDANGMVLSGLEYYRDPDIALSRASLDKEFTANLVLESGYLATDVDLEFLRDQKQVCSTLQTFTYNLITAFEQENLPHFRRIAANGNETIEYGIGYQHTPDDEDNIFAEGRKPYGFNIVKPIARSMLGEIAKQKTRGRAVPRNSRSAPKAEIGDKLLNWIAQDNKLQRTRAIVARDGIFYGVGFAGIRQHPLDPFGRILIEPVRPQECMWDIVSTPHSISKAKYFWRMTWHDRVTLASEFPEWRDQILFQTGDFSTPRAWEADFAMVRPKVRVPAGQQDYTSQFQPTYRQLYGRLLVKREFYIRRTVGRLAVTDPFTGRTFTFRGPEDAYAKQKDLERQYMQSPVWSTFSPNIRANLFTARPTQVEVWDQFIFIGNRLVRVNSASECGLPYIPYAPEYYGGDVTPWLDYLKDPQRWLNRSVSMLDQIFAGTKGGYIINRRWFNSEWDDEKIRDYFNQTNWKIIMDEMDPEFDASKIVHYVQEHHNTAELMSMVQFVQNFTTQVSGGANRMGLEAFAGQSARSAEDLRAAGSGQTMDMLDLLREWEEMVYENALYRTQYLHPAAQLRVYDDDKTPEFFSLLSEGVESMEDYSFDVAIEEVLATPSERQARFGRLMTLAGQLGPNYASKIIPMALKNADLDYSERQQIEAAIAQEDAFQKQMQVGQQQLAMEEMRRHMAVQETNTYLKGRDQVLREQNLPKFMGSFDPSKLSPAAFTTFLNWAAINVAPEGMAHPAMVTADMAAGQALRQSAITMQQILENENTPEWQKEAIRNKIAVRKGFPTADDAGNRAVREVKNGNSI